MTLLSGRAVDLCLSSKCIISMLFGQVDRKSGTVKQRAWTEGISPLWCFPTGNVLSKEWPSNMMSTRQSTWLTWLERWGRGGEKKSGRHLADEHIQRDGQEASPNLFFSFSGKKDVCLLKPFSV